MNAEEQLLDPMPIVVGYPRSGTTLLRLMLDAHPDVAIPPETGFLVEMTDPEFSGSWLDVWSLITEHESWPVMKLDAGEFRNRLEAAGEPSLAEVVRTFYRLYAERFAKPRWGDKTPYYAGVMTRIQGLLPEARFIHMIRDGRDTAVSVRGLWFSPGDDAETLANSWVRRTERARAQKDELAGYLEVRYEDLVTRPEEELRRVCGFLHLDFHPAMLEHHRSAASRLSEMTPDGMMDRDDEEIPDVIRLARKPVDQSRIGRWRRELAPREIATYEAFAGSTLTSFGYQMESGRAARAAANARAQVSAFRASVSSWEWGGLAGAMLLSALIVVAYTLITRPNELAGDQRTYHDMGVYFTQGKLWWTDLPYGIPHASAWKAPIYPAWVGFWYELIGPSPTRLALIQGVVLAPLTVFFTWLLGRRLFGSRVAVAAAFLIAVFPFSWEYIGLLYPEAIAIPLTVAAMWVFLGREPTTVVALGAGALIGACMLVRPNSFFLFAGALVGWWVMFGARRAIKGTALSLVVAVLMIAPWTVRNAIAVDGFVPISIQDAAVYGTFNDTAANDEEFPYAWRPRIEPMPEVFNEPGTSDAELRSRLLAQAREYVFEHPESLFEAYFWNGIVRFWDIQRPSNVEHGIEGSGRAKLTGFFGFGLYWLLVPFALLAFWRLRRSRAVFYALLASAIVLSISVIPDSTTRYRAPLEPVIAILACAAVVPLTQRFRASGETLPSSPGAEPPSAETASGPRLALRAPVAAGAAGPSYAQGFVLDGGRSSMRRLLSDVWQSRELIRILSRKDFFVLYRRASFGMVWAIVVPLLQAAVMSVILTQFVRFDEVSPYPVYVFGGVVAWTFFAGAMNAGTVSIVAAGDLSSKIYFPRAIFPLVSIGAACYTLMPGVAVLVLAAVVFGASLGAKLLLLIPAVALLVALALGFALLLSALYVYFRDVRFIVQASLIAWFYATPIIYPIGRTGFAEPYIEANPMTGVVELFHEATVGIDGSLLVPLAWTVAWTVAVFGAGLVLHRKHDRNFGDLL